ADTERQDEGPGAVVDADPVVSIPELQPEQDLRQIVTARGELIQDLALRQQPRLLDVIERAGGVQQPDDDPPVGLGAGYGALVSEGWHRSRACGHEVTGRAGADGAAYALGRAIVLLRLPVSPHLWQYPCASPGGGEWPRVLSIVWIGAFSKSCRRMRAFPTRS